MPTDPAGSMYLSRMAEYKDHKDQTRIHEEDEDEDQLSHSSLLNSRYLYSPRQQSKWSPHAGAEGRPFVPNSSVPMTVDLSEPGSPRHDSVPRRPMSSSLDQDIPSELGDFAPARMFHPEEYQDQNEDDDGKIDPDEENNVLGLLNQIYDHTPQIK
jgi:hypothetical protein